ncbi:hypothetical protein NMY22_g7178 [Coprinellus aureogranulatus]|nr:hypothetical protein NMY22_g7178 [Coprinellus aureogranulatus]
MDVKTRIACMLTHDPLDVFHFGNTCHELNMAVEHAWAEMIHEWLRNFAIKHGWLFLSLMDINAAILSGPGLLGVLFPESIDALDRMGCKNRLEIHLPRSKIGISVISDFLSGLGYYLQVMLEYPAAQHWCKVVLGYHYFGWTLQAVWNWAKLKDDGTVTEITIFVSQSSESAIGTVVEQPSTLFMNYIAEGHITVMYPTLTLNRRAIINGPCIRETEYSFIYPLASARFQHTTSLNFLPGYANHKCGVDLACPNRTRQLHDTHSRHIPFKCEGTAPLSRGPFVEWRLKCVASCEQPKPYSPHTHRRPRYTVGHIIWGEHRLTALRASMLNRGYDVDDLDVNSYPIETDSEESDDGY